MTLLPMDIAQHTFQHSFRGFNPVEVRAFLDTVSHHVTALLAETDRLRLELQLTQKTLLEHQAREDDLRQAMLTAQRAVEDVRDMARKEAQVLIGHAEVEADKIIHHAHAQANVIKQETRSLRAQRLRALEELRGIVQTHQRLLDAAEESFSGTVDDGKVMFLEAVRAPMPPR